jgi:hypothetical protein
MFPSPGIVNQSVAPASVADTADQIHELVAAELTLQETGGTVTSTAVEQTLYINDNPLGCFRPRRLFVDLDNMAAGADSVAVRIYYRLNAGGGGLQLLTYQAWTGVDGGLANGAKLVTVELYENRFGVQVTLQRIGGSDYAFDWEIFTEE